MIHAEGSFQGAEGIRLFRQHWLPQEEPASLLIIVHGVHEHSGRYSSIVEALVKEGIAVYSYDQRGHGRSEGLRGHILSWNEYREDLDLFLKLVRMDYPETPIFFMGHSMGALVVLDYVVAKQPDISGIIVSGTPNAPIGVASPLMILLARLLSGICPQFSLHPPFRPESISSDPDAVRAYIDDPLVHHQVTARWGTESLQAVERVNAQAESVRLPILMLHGGNDPVNSIDGSRAYFDRLPSPDKQFIAYGGAYHEPHNDHCRQQVAADIHAWLDRHAPGHA